MHGLVRLTGHPRFAWDCRRRFLESYGEVVLDIDKASFARTRAAVLAHDAATSEQAADSETIERLACGYQQLIEDEAELIPDNGFEQLEAAANAVYRSWMSARAVTYRKLQHLDDLAGHRRHRAGHGVRQQRRHVGRRCRLLARPVDRRGAAGDRRACSTRKARTWCRAAARRRRKAAIQQALPHVAAQLREILARLEREFTDVQDIEFTIQDGRLWILQTRAAKRTPQAALRFAIDS